jgi:hypothetical protein
MKVRKLMIFNRNFEYWFDRVWYAMEVDGDGNQIGEAIDSYDRDMLLVLVGVRASTIGEEN